MKNVVIVGTGLIGGSFGLALRKAGFDGVIRGVRSCAMGALLDGDLGIAFFDFGLDDVIGLRCCQASAFGAELVLTAKAPPLFPSQSQPLRALARSPPAVDECVCFAANRHLLEKSEREPEWR